MTEIDILINLMKENLGSLRYWAGSLDDKMRGLDPNNPNDNEYLKYLKKTKRDTEDQIKKIESMMSAMLDIDNSDFIRWLK